MLTTDNNNSSGWCGDSKDHCGSGCQSGDCIRGAETTDGTCGKAHKDSVCGKWPQGSCCSPSGFCGATQAHCGVGCQSGPCGWRTFGNEERFGSVNNKEEWL